MKDPFAWEIAKTCAVEAFEAGCAKGINFTFDDIIQYVTDFGNNMPDARPSMLLDHLDHPPPGATRTQFCGFSSAGYSVRVGLVTR